MEYLTLNNGVEIPALGFGVYQIEDAALCEQVVVDSLGTGYRLIDTAAAYLNEEAVGRGIRRSGVARQDIFLTTKLWIQDAGYEKAKAAFNKSLERLGVEYIDLYLIHQPINDYYGAWRAMEEIYREGRARAIGVCNFMPDRLADLLAFNDVAPAIDQVEVNPFCQRQDDQKFMEENKVRMQSWGPFAEGKNDIFHNPVLTSIAEAHKKTVAQVILRWLVQREVVCIPKSVHRDRMEQNFNVFDFSLDYADMAKIAGLDTGKSCFFSHYDPKIVSWLAGVRYDI